MLRYLLLFVAVPVLFAQTAETPQPRRDPNDVLKPNLSWKPKPGNSRQIWLSMSPIQPVTEAAPGRCSIPLVTIPVDPNLDSKMVIKVTPGESRMQVQAPAPPCENWPMK